MAPLPDAQAPAVAPLPVPAPEVKPPPGFFGLAGITLATLFKTVKVLMGVSGFMYLCKSLAEHTRMTFSERAAKQREEELRKQLLDEEMEAQDEEIKELEATLNRRSIAWAPE